MNDTPGSSPKLPPLNWRMDPEESYSDWKITINSKDIYHVHKCILGFGEKGSEYFAGLFRSNFSESESNIALAEHQARVFPLALDYVYGSNAAFEAHNIAALWEVSDYFGFHGLHKQIKNQIRQSFNSDPASVAVVYRHARDLDNTRLQQFIIYR